MNMADRYATLFASLAELEDRRVAETIFEKLMTHIRSTGRLGLLPQVLRALTAVHKQNEQAASRMEVAKASQIEDAKHIARRLGIPYNAILVNTDLISGWRAYENNRLKQFPLLFV